MNERKSLALIVLLAMVGVSAFFLWSQGGEVPAREVKLAAADSHPPRAKAAQMIPVATVQSDAPVSDDQVSQWLKDAAGGDAGKRAAAITGLANAPVSQALPVLRRVLMNGEPRVDRPLALQSLRDLALNHGDPQSSIRNAIREAIYHGDDQTMSADAQEALDVIEESQLR